MKTDEEFNTLLIKLIFCRDNMSYTGYTGYTGALTQTKTVKNIIIHVLNKVNLRKKIKLELSDELEFSISHDDGEVLDIYITIRDLNSDIDQIMIPINLNDIKNQPKWALLFPGEEEIKL